MKNIIIFLSAFFLTSCTTISHIENEATKAISEERYAKAYELTMLLLSKKEDSEYQLSAAILLVSDKDIGVSLSRSEREKQALNWIILSAKSGNVKSLDWLAHSYRHGEMGLDVNQSAAQCLDGAAKGKSDKSLCIKYIDAIRQ